MRANRHHETREGWPEVVSMVGSILICTVGASVVAWACFEAMRWAMRMGWL